MDRIAGPAEFRNPDLLIAIPVSRQNGLEIFRSSEGKVLSQNDGQGEHREGKEYDQYDLGQRVRGEHQTPQIAGEAIWQRLQ